MLDFAILLAVGLFLGLFGLGSWLAFGCYKWSRQRKQRERQAQQDLADWGIR